MAAILAAVMSAGLSGEVADRRTHLFILSGQSNMVRLDPSLSFTPAVTRAFSSDQVIVVKDAQGGESIRHWYKQWKSTTGNRPKATGGLYDRLMDKVGGAINDRRPDTVTFVWVQGERDAVERQGDVYATSLRGLIAQLETDLDRHDIHVVIGRIPGANSSGEDNRHWTMVRRAQMDVAESLPRGAWVDTDDLEIARDGKHFTKNGSTQLGARLAAKAIELLQLSRVLIS